MGDKELWGGRFRGAMDETFARFNRSLDVDRRLIKADVRASIAQANALRGAGVLTKDEAAAIERGLKAILERADEPGFFGDPAIEDVHTLIEVRLVEAIGEAGKKLHTGRSRNDQTATALRLWLREEIDELDVLAGRLQSSLLDAAERHAAAVMPGYTHLQRAQPILWPHWCLAYFEMLRRDRQRLIDARRRVNVMPLGSGALAGTGYPVDREAAARELGFQGITANSLDAVSDRDPAVEFAGTCCVVMMHLSRLAEDLIIYSTQEFGLVSFSDAVATGSSLMPQKKNPDALELIRGKAARVFGHHAALLALMKGLPLAYNKDMQEDKQAVMDCADTTADCLKVAAIVMDDLTVNESRAREAATKGWLNATELADHLVKMGMPFREAHSAAGRLVLYASENGKELEELRLEEMGSVVPGIDETVYEALSLESALVSKAATGGTAPARVSEALAAARRYLRPAGEE
jgi:argininosuccinate lyase